MVAYDSHTAARQTEKRRAEIKAVEALGQKLADKLDAQDVAEAALKIAAASRRKSSKIAQESASKKRRKKASDRSAYVRFANELKDRKLTKYFTVDWEAKDFTFERNEAAIAASKALDGKLVLLTSLSESVSSSTQTVLRYKALADIERGFRD